MPPVSPPLSRARHFGDLLFTSGQLARGPGGAIVGTDVGAQTRQALANLEAVLRDHGSALTDVVKVTVWLVQVADMAAFNEVYRSIMPEPFPARSTVVCGLVPGALVEIEAIAIIPPNPA